MHSFTEIGSIKKGKHANTLKHGKIRIFACFIQHMWYLYRRKRVKKKEREKERKKDSNTVNPKTRGKIEFYKNYSVSLTVLSKWTFESYLNLQQNKRCKIQNKNLVSLAFFFALILALGLLKLCNNFIKEFTVTPKRCQICFS